jgi:hypothetical protein
VPARSSGWAPPATTGSLTASTPWAAPTTTAAWVEQAAGEVLEIGAGTRRNPPWYRPPVYPPDQVLDTLSWQRNESPNDSYSLHGRRAVRPCQVNPTGPAAVGECGNSHASKAASPDWTPMGRHFAALVASTAGRDLARLKALAEEQTSPNRT